MILCFTILSQHKKSELKNSFPIFAALTHKRFSGGNPYVIAKSSPTRDITHACLRFAARHR